MHPCAHGPRLALVFSLTLLTLACDGPEDGSWASIADPNGAFAISAPSRWNVKTDRDADYSEMIVSSTSGPSITVSIHSRALSQEEKAMPALDLLDAMMNSWVETLRQQGNSILEVGKAREMVPGFPTFVISSTTEDGERVVTSWGTVAGDRNYGITSLTVNRDGSDELAETVRRVVESFQVTN